MATPDPQLRTDILSEDLTTDQKKIQIIAETLYSQVTKDAIVLEHLGTTPNPAKTIFEAMDLFKVAIEDYERREDKINDAKVIVTYEKPDKEIEKLLIERKGKAIITIGLTRRQPGAFGKGAPWQSSVANQVPILREEFPDPDYPGYQRSVLGYYYDNLITLTVWARTNKVANEVSLWVENVMEEYTWFFRWSGVARFLFDGRQKDEHIDVDQNRYYGRPIDYFVRTEKLKEYSQKELEKIIIRLQVSAR